MLSPAFTAPNTRFCPSPQSIALLSLSILISIANCTKLKRVLLPCSTYFSCFPWVGHGGCVLSPCCSSVTVPGVLQIPVASIPSEMLFLERPDHFEAVWLLLLCFCSSELFGVSIRLLGFYVSQQAARKGVRWGLPGFLLLPVLGLEGICQNYFFASAHEKTSTGICLPSGRGSSHQ